MQLWRELEGAKGLTPPWVDKENDVRTIRFSNTVARELATLITQNIDIKVQMVYGTGEKAQYIQNALDKTFMAKAQENIEKMIRLGGIMAKWNGSGIDYIPPDMFLVTDFDSNGTIEGCVFLSHHNENDKFYTRAEWHRFERVNRRNEETGESEQVRIYKISNKAFVSSNAREIGRKISLKNTKWKDLEEEVTIEGLRSPLFTYLKNPFSNTIDTESPLGVSLFSECIEELRWLDIAMSALGVETENSEPVMFVDNSSIQYAKNNNIKLPKFIGGLDMGIDPTKTVEQWQPNLQVANRKEGINFYLSIISAKVGFSQGYFNFNENQGTIVTATQVEAAERRTVNTVLSYRNLLDRPNTNGDGRVGFIHDIAYIIDTMSTLNGETPPEDYGNYKIFCDFADITSNKQEDMLLDLQLTNQGFMSKARFLVRHRGFTEDEAKKMVEEAQKENKSSMQKGLFNEE